METATRQSAPLPPMKFTEPFKREEAEIQAAQTMVNINPHAAHVAPYSYASTATSSAPTSASATKTPPGSHRSSQTDFETHSSSAPLKQSLPSIHEALAQRSGDEQSRSRPRSPPVAYQYVGRKPSTSPPRYSRSYGPERYEESQQPHQHHHQRQTSQYEHTTSHPSTSPRLFGPVTSAPPRPPSPNDRFTVPQSRTPQYVTTTGAPPRSPLSASQHGPAPLSSSFAASPYLYSSHRESQNNYVSPSSQDFVTSYPAVATSAHISAREPPRLADNASVPTDGRVDHREPQFPTTVRRNLDYYDLDALLNEVYDCSHNLMQFSEVYRTRGPQTQRSGRIAGSTPTISDVHHALKFHAKIGEALDFTLQKLRADEAERIERETREAAERRQHQHGTDRVEEAPPRVRKEPADGGFTAPPDPKKRRGRAAPPGRCHACNRAETPEWRRGPDGARTLCNACGLHYAKHTRKLGAQKAAAMAAAGSNLQPKSTASS